MNSIQKFFNNKIVLIAIIIILVIILIFLLTDNFTDTFNNLNNNRVPPHIENLMHEQMTPQVPPAADQTPAKSTNATDNNAPNYNRKNEINTPENTKMIPGNIYRMKTGRQAFEQEQFVSIYDANFGGYLGTNLGLM